MTWWCSSTGEPWTGAWRAYPGVWVLVGLLVAAGLRPRRSSGAAAWLPYMLGVAGLWIATDWPLGPLGAGYLLTAHTVQFLLISFVAAPLLLVGACRAGRLDGLGRPGRLLAHPLLGLGSFTAIMTITHLPAVVDGLMVTQAGSFVIDLLWLVGGWSLYWPVVAGGEYARLSPLLSVGYLFAATVVATVPAAFLTFARYPIYTLYEFAPRVLALSAREDQQVAGLVMKTVGDPLIWIAMALAFLRWQRAERAAEHSNLLDPGASHAS